MSIQSPNLSGLSAAAGNLVTFPKGTASLPLIKMSPEKAEANIRDALAAAFLSDPGTLKEIRLLDHIELRLARVEEGVDIEINDIKNIEQIWRKNYLGPAWAIRGLAAILAKSRLGLDLPNVPRRKSPRPIVSAADLRGRSAMDHDDAQSGVWKKRIQPDIWDASFGEGRGRVEAVLVVDADGADATLKWRDAMFESSFEGEWEAKSSTLKLVHELPGWRLIMPQTSCTNPEDNA